MAFAYALRATGAIYNLPLTGSMVTLDSKTNFLRKIAWAISLTANAFACTGARPSQYGKQRF
ncbi:hypothetical protein [Mesorhizobium sp. M0522]|uniref:hypothetical protein n=1 Tax=Mesorhizobium sp. M0522 TaxID=2956958 RepID=UPI00333A471A